MSGTRGDRGRAAQRGRDARISEAISGWFAREARELPWRTRPLGSKRDPYVVLVSEMMLQQTQASRVAERLGGMLERFPGVRELARASDEEVLAAWSGLGYYRRAIHLRNAAQVVVAEHGGKVPGDVAQLMLLPGVGRYTAGAIASLAFGRREAMVDGNAGRVLMRIEGVDGAWDASARGVVWGIAERLVRAAKRPAVFNEGLMELGAMVCTPRAPACDRCPVAEDCEARRRGRAGSIPRRVRSGERREIYAASVVVRARGRTLVRMREKEGMWGGLWEAPTLETERALTRARVARWLGIGAEGLLRVEAFDHATTHRLVRFSVWRVEASGAGARAIASRFEGSKWRTRGEIGGLGLSSPQRRILLGGGR